jgi:hypothetical protein
MKAMENNKKNIEQKERMNFGEGHKSFLVMVNDEPSTL